MTDNLLKLLNNASRLKDFYNENKRLKVSYRTGDDNFEGFYDKLAVEVSYKTNKLHDKELRKNTQDPLELKAIFEHSRSKDEPKE